MNTQLDLFTGEPVPTRKPAKKLKPVQTEMFSQAETAQFGVTSAPKMDLHPGKLALLIEDPRTPEQIEADRIHDAQELTDNLFKE